MDRIATVALARDPVRVTLLVGLRLAVGVVALDIGISSQGEGSAGIALTVAGWLVIAYATVLATVLTSLRVEIFQHEVHLAAPFVRWPFSLTSGPISRWPSRRASRLTSWVSGFGVRLGGAQSADGERLTVVGLDPGRPLLLLPTRSGRLGVWVRDEGLLIHALVVATRGGRRT